jgi:hypothetical protein
MRNVMKRYGLVALVACLLGLGGFAVASKISVGTAVTFPVDI